MSPVAARNGADDDDEAMAYDPEMDPAETRKIRKQYREVLATQAGKLSNGVFFFDLLTLPLPESRANIGTVQVPDLMQDLSQLDSMFSGGKPRVPFMTSLHDYIVGPPVGISEAGSGGDARFKGCNELVRNDCNESTRHEA